MQIGHVMIIIAAAAAAPIMIVSNKAIPDNCSSYRLTPFPPTRGRCCVVVVVVIVVGGVIVDGVGVAAGMLAR